jgi:hypothetical protein
MAAIVWMSREKTLIRNPIKGRLLRRFTAGAKVLLTAEQPRRDVDVNESFNESLR